MNIAKQEGGGTHCRLDSYRKYPGISYRCTSLLLTNRVQETLNRHWRYEINSKTTYIHFRFGMGLSRRKLNKPRKMHFSIFILESNATQCSTLQACSVLMVALFTEL